MRLPGNRRLHALSSAIVGLCGLMATSHPAQAQFRSLENPSFEANDPAGPGSPNYEILPIGAVPGWDTTTGEIELWDSNFNAVPAYAGNVFAEMNANVNGTFYQSICLINGEPLGWTFAHRARTGGPATQTVRFQVANNSGTVLQSLATQSSSTGSLVWNINSGSRTYNGASGMQRVQFTTTDTGSFGNFLDAIQLTLRPFIQLSAGTGSALESVPTTGVPTLRITGSSASAINVTVTITGGTAVRGSDYATPAGGATFTVSVPAGIYNNSAVPLGITITNDAAVESNETIVFSLSAGTGYTVAHTSICGASAQTSSTFTIINDDARVTLRKQWVNGVADDDANVTLARGATVIDTLVSDAGTDNELDVDPTSTPAVIGETLIVGEVLPGSNAGRYNAAAACTGAADINLADGLTIGTGETSIVCTYTNTRIPPLVVSKTSVVLSDGVTVSGPMAIPGAVLRYCILVTNPGTLAATDVLATDLLPATISYLPGSARSGTSCAAATNLEDDNGIGTDETDPFGVSITGSTLTGYAASLAGGTNFAMRFNATLN